MRARGVLTCVGLAAMIAFALSAAAQGALPRPVYFFRSTIDTVDAQNQLVVRPAGFLMFEDGSWDLQGLRWTGWGTSVATASGISSASNDIPNAAEGKRTSVAARVTLSNPGPFQGHEVYRCFQLTVPTHPASNERVCLKQVAGAWSFVRTPSAPAQSPALGSSPAAADFLVPAVAGSCEMHDSTSDGALVYCETLSPERTVQLKVDGQLEICSATTTCDVGNPGLGTPRLAPGKQITVGRFRCRSAAAALTCIVIKTGRGFLLTKSAITPIGGATATTAVFYSPDRKVSCEMADPDTNGYYVYCNASGLHAVTLGPDGHATICDTGCLGMEPPATPTLAYGQQITVGRFQCTSAISGITCIVTRSRRGFLINATAAALVGPPA
jgi:hypothetical protein